MNVATKVEASRHDVERITLSNDNFMMLARILKIDFEFGDWRVRDEGERESCLARRDVNAKLALKIIKTLKWHGWKPNDSPLKLNWLAAPEHEKFSL